MSIPIIQTRIRIPPLPAWYLPRPQLDRRWREWEGKRLVTVTAGAGFGKTSFIAAHASSVPGCGWYSLDESDSDPLTFCAHLAAAVRLPQAGEVPPAVEGGGAADPDRLIAELVKLLEDRSRRLLVLDDFQLAAVSAEVRRLIDRLIRYLPGNTVLVLSSREPVELNLGRIRAAGAAAQLEARDLRFKTSEVQALFDRHFPGARLPERLCSQILRLTEGWAAGLEILFQALEGPAPRSVEEALRRLEDSPDGWFSYFAQEVLARLDQRTEDFLMRSAVLPRMNPRVCDRVLGIEGSRQILEELHRRNLFTFAEAGEEPVYRYHHLFRDFLRDRLLRSARRTEVARLFSRTGRELERAGAWAEAAAAHSEGGNHDGTLKLVEKLGEQLLSQGQYRTVERALEGVPQARINHHARALLVFGRLREIQGRWGEAESLFRRALRLGQESGLRVELESLVAQLEMRRGDFVASRRRCRKALGHRGPDGAQVRSRLLALLGICACSLGRLDEGEEHFQQALDLFRQRRDTLGEGRILYLLAANVHYQRGEFRRARDRARHALLLFRRLQDPRRICHSLGVLGFVTAGSAREREARDLSEEALRLAETLDYTLVIGYCRLTLGRCALISQDTESAAAHFEAALEIGQRLGETFLRSFPLLGLAETALAADNRHLARRHAEAALALAEALKDPLLQAQCRILLGLAGALARKERRDEYWREAERAVRSLGARFELHRLLLYRLAEGAATEGEVPRLLAELLVGTAELDHEFLFLVLEPDRAVRVLVEAIRLGVETGYAGRLLVRLGRRASPALASLAADPSGEVRERTVELLAQIGGEEAREALARMSRGSGSTGRAAARAADELEKAPATPLVITALGPLTVSVGDRTLTLDQWKSARSRRLFQLLLVHRFRWVARDVIIEALWPEVDPDKGVNNLRQAIHLLRRSLEPRLDRPGSSSYVRYRNEACRLEGGEGCRYDVAEMEAALQEAEGHWNRGRRGEARPLLERVAQLYKGTFLEESPYEEFATLERERLRDRFLRALGRLIELGAGGKEWGNVVLLCRRGLDQAPYQEALYWHLVRSLYELGHRHEALDAYHQYEKNMVRELDLLPSARMQDLARRISRVER